VKLDEPLSKVAIRLKQIAHDPANWVYLSRGERVEQKKIEADGELVPLLPLVRYSMRFEGWETRITFIYSVDVVPVPVSQSGDDAEESPHRHLQIQMSIPQQLTQGELNLALSDPKGLMALLTPLVSLFFPMHDHIKMNSKAHAPIPVRDARQGTKGNVHFRTPVSFHFFVGLNDTTAVAGGRDSYSGMHAAGGRLLGPDGNPL